MTLLTTLPPPVLEAVRDEFKEMANERTGPRGELKRAWLNCTQQASGCATAKKLSGCTRICGEGRTVRATTRAHHGPGIEAAHSALAMI